MDFIVVPVASYDNEKYVYVSMREDGGQDRALAFPFSPKEARGMIWQLQHALRQLGESDTPTPNEEAENDTTELGAVMAAVDAALTPRDENDQVTAILTSPDGTVRKIHIN